MAAIATNADGTTVFMALERGSSPVVLSAARTDLTTWTVVYEPGEGSAANVLPFLSDSDSMLFYGNFDTDVTVIKHTISTATNTDISPASLGAKVVNTAVINPSDSDEIIISVDTDQDLKHTSDGGTTWTDWDAALGFDATALWALWSGTYFPAPLFCGGKSRGR